MRTKTNLDKAREMKAKMVNETRHMVAAFFLAPEERDSGARV
jgi:hypothetical protein